MTNFQQQKKYQGIQETGKYGPFKGKKIEPVPEKDLMIIYWTMT